MNAIDPFNEELSLGDTRRLQDEHRARRLEERIERARTEYANSKVCRFYDTVEENIAAITAEYDRETVELAETRRVMDLTDAEAARELRGKLNELLKLRQYAVHKGLRVVFSLEKDLAVDISRPLT